MAVLYPVVEGLVNALRQYELGELNGGEVNRLFASYGYDAEGWHVPATGGAPLFILKRAREESIAGAVRHEKVILYVEKRMTKDVNAHDSAVKLNGGKKGYKIITREEYIGDGETRVTPVIAVGLSTDGLSIGMSGRIQDSDIWHLYQIAKFAGMEPRYTGHVWKHPATNNAVLKYVSEVEAARR